MKKVLLINPVKNSLASNKNILDRDNLLIFTAATAAEALRIHQEEMVDLFVAELDLPDMGGDVLCSRIRNDQALRKVSVILVCSDTPTEVRRAESCGANARLLKPVTPEQLSDSVGKFLAVPTRQDYRVLVRVQVYSERGMTVLFCSSRNISVSGLLIETDGLLSAGDRISCMFFLPGLRQVTAIGEVIRAARLTRTMNQYGIRFITLNPQSQAEIENFVSTGASAEPSGHSGAPLPIH